MLTYDNMKRENKNEENKEKHEMQEMQVLFNYLKISQDDIVYRHPSLIDFEILLDGKRIGIEQTDIRPYTIENKYAKPAIEDIVKEILLNEFDDTISVVTINISLTDHAYKNGIVVTKLKQEVKDWLCGIANSSGEYIESINVQSIPDAKIPKEQVFFNFQYEGFLPTVPIKYIMDSHNDKISKFIKNYNNLLKPIDPNGFDEVWLCITLPSEEKGYKIPSFRLNNSRFDRVYLTQSYPWPNLIELYKK